MKLPKRQYLLLIIFSALTLTGILILNLYPADVSRTTNQTVTTEGDIISFNLYQPKGLTEPTPVVVMGHGIIVNKEMMTSFAMELANAGLIVANLDWNGHGQSTGELGNLADDLEAVIAAIPLLQPLANMSAIALLGYSMGGFGTYPYAVNHSNVLAWVGVGTLPDGAISNTTNPQNVFVIVGSLDEAITPNLIKADMVNLTGVSSADEFEFETLYGSMNNGTARKVHIVPGADHLVTPWHRDFVVPATLWITESLGIPQSPSSSWVFDLRSAFAWIGFLSLVGVLFVSAEILSDKFKVRKDTNSAPQLTIDPKGLKETSLLSFIGKYYLITFLLLPTIVLFIPLFFTPIAITAVIVAMIGCYSVNLLIYGWRLAKRWNFSLKSLLRENISAKLNVWIYAIVLTVIFFFGYYLSIGLNFLGMIPAIIRIPYLILYCGILFFIIFVSSTFVQKIALPYFDAKFQFKNSVVNYIVKSLIIFILVDSWFVILIMIPCIIVGNYFLAMFLLIMFPIFLMMICFGLYMEKLTGSVIPGVLLHTILIGFLIVTLSPYGNIIDFITGLFASSML